MYATRAELDERFFGPLDRRGVPDGMVRMRRDDQFLLVRVQDIDTYFTHRWWLVSKKESAAENLLFGDDVIAAGEMRAVLAMAERGLVDVEIVKKGDGSEAPSDQVRVKTTLGHEVWVPERDVIARKPNPEQKSG
jgi:hypothetical protein